MPKPKLLTVEYVDGLRVNFLELNGAIGEWGAAWRYDDDRRVESTQFRTQEARPAGHFTLLLHGIEQMMLTGKPTWNVERTLLDQRHARRAAAIPGARQRRSRRPI